MEWEIFFIPLIVIFGLITSYSDFKKGKIYNKHIIIFLTISLMAYISLPFFNIVNLEYLSKLFLNIFISLVIGIILWNLDLWNPADAKLFLTYTAMVPLLFYTNTYHNFFPSSTILINSFVPFFIVYFFKLSFIGEFKEKMDPLKEIRIIDIVKIVLIVLTFLWIPRILSITLNINLGFVANLFIIMVLVFLLNKLLKDKFIFLLIFIFVLRIVFDFDYVMSIEFLVNFISISLIIIAVFIITKIGESSSINEIKVENLKEGMFLDKNLHNHEGKPLPLENSQSGLTKKDIKIIKKFRGSNELMEDKVKVRQMLPFSPFVFLGTVLTLILKGDFIIVMGRIITDNLF